MDLQLPELGWRIFGIAWEFSAMAAVFAAIDHNKSHTTDGRFVVEAKKMYVQP